MSEQALCCTQDARAENGHKTDHNLENRQPVFRPHVDLVDTGDAVILWADLPGVDENSVDITLEKNILTLKASVQPPTFEGMKPLRREFAVGDYERRFTVSEEIDRDGIEATVTQGVLKLTLPKSQQAATKKVTVKAG